MRAKVLKEFPGCTDDNPITRMIKEGEIISGDLAKVAIGEGWAEEAADDAVADNSPDMPAFDDMNMGQLKAYAAERQIDLGTATRRAEIIAVLKAVRSGDEA
ncbi:hypothetical protein [Rhizobium leguminosarum]|uniref:hypothetical protein n=1 Tax=Rhizobium leguminosarum TaxID=384 RepID=UPI003F964CD9